MSVKNHWLRKQARLGFVCRQQRQTTQLATIDMPRDPDSQTLTDSVHSVCHRVRGEREARKLLTRVGFSCRRGQRTLHFYPDALAHLMIDWTARRLQGTQKLKMHTNLVCIFSWYYQDKSAHESVLRLCARGWDCLSSGGGCACSLNFASIGCRERAEGMHQKGIRSSGAALAQVSHTNLQFFLFQSCSVP
jgi:hypothetical protein